MKRKLIVVSHDAMVKEDLDHLYKRPAFRHFIDDGSFIETVRTVYPTVTYPCHASMISGCYPDKTGVIANEVEYVDPTLRPEGNLPWVWERKWNKCKTLIDAAKEAGCTTANVFWPVLASDENIDYNIPEYWPVEPSRRHDKAEIYKDWKNFGVKDEVFRDIIEPNFKLTQGHEGQHPYSDDFVLACACDIIEKYNPDVMFVHPAGLDAARHSSGLFGADLPQNLDHTSYWMDRLIESAKRAGTYENTDFVMMSDHGQMNISRWIRLNVLLKNAGFITTDGNNRVTSYKAYASSVGASCYIYLADKTMKTYDEVYSFLKDKCKEGIYGFSQVFTEPEIREKEHLGGNFDFMLETDGISAFGWEFDADFVSYIPNADDYRTGKATHGYLPDKSVQPLMIFCGPDFKKGVKIDRRNIVDFAPTIAKVFGWSLPDADGKPIDEVIEKQN